MYSNFDFLKETNKNLYELGKSIESQVYTSPSAVLTEGTTFLDNLIYTIFENENMSHEDIEMFGERCEKLNYYKIISDNYKRYLQKTFNIRNKMHSCINSTENYLKGNKQRAIAMAKRLFECAWYYYSEYLGNTTKKPKYIPIDELDKSFPTVKKCIICGKKTTKNSFFCKSCFNLIQNYNDTRFFADKFGFFSLFGDDDLVLLGYSDDELEKIIPQLMSRKLIFKINNKYVINQNEFEDITERIEQYNEIEILVKNFFEGKLSLYQLRETEAYKKGENLEKRYVNFYKFVNKKLKKLFLEKCEGEESIEEIINMNIISKKDYNDLIKKAKSFVLIKKLENEFIDYKKAKQSKEEIKSNLGIDDETFQLLDKSTRKDFDTFVIKQHIYDYLEEGKTYAEVLSNKNISLKDFHDYVSQDDEFKKKLQVLNNKKEEILLQSLKTKGLKDSLKEANIISDKFEKALSKNGFNKVNNILKNNYLEFLKNGKTNEEIIEILQIDDCWLSKWLEDKSFKNKTLNILSKNILKLLYDEISLNEALKRVGISKKNFEKYLMSKKEFSNIIKDDESLLADKSLKISFKHFKLENKSKNEIKSALSITNEVYDFFDDRLSNEVDNLLKNRFISLLENNFSYNESIKESNISIDKLNYFREIDKKFDDKINKIFNERYSILINTLEDNGFKTALKISNLNKINLDNFDELNNILKTKYIDLIKEGYKSKDALDKCEIDSTILNKWLGDKSFKNQLKRISTDLFLNQLQKGVKLETALKNNDISKKEFNNIVLNIFKKGNTNDDVLNIYFKEVFPTYFSKFLNEFSDNNEQNSLKKAGLDKDIFIFELNRNEVLQKQFLKAKKRKYLNKYNNSNHDAALKYSELSKEEFEANKDELINQSNKNKKDILIKKIEKFDKTPYQASKQLNLNLDEIYEEYLKGISGEGDEEFAYEFERVFITPIMDHINKLVNDDGFTINKALKMIKNGENVENIKSVGEKIIKSKIKNKAVNKKFRYKNEKRAKQDKDLVLSNEDYKLWRKYNIFENYNNRHSDD